MNSALDFPSSQSESKLTSSFRSSDRASLQGAARESLLDSVELRGSFSFKKEQLERTLQAAEEQQFSRYRRKIKPVSLFFVIFAVLILLNACIGYSSSPFYDQFTECSLYELTEECKALRHRVSALYAFEAVGSMFLVANGLIGMILVEHTKNLRLMTCLNVYTKIALIFYVICAVLRISMYFKVLVLLAPLEEKPQDFGGFLAVYALNDTVANIITVILMLTYTTCFLSSFYLICVTSNLKKFTVENEERKLKEAEELKRRRKSSQIEMNYGAENRINEAIWRTSSEKEDPDDENQSKSEKSRQSQEIQEENNLSQETPDVVAQKHIEEE